MACDPSPSKASGLTKAGIAEAAVKVLWVFPGHGSMDGLTGCQQTGSLPFFRSPRQKDRSVNGEQSKEILNPILGRAVEDSLSSQVDPPSSLIPVGDSDPRLLAWEPHWSCRGQWLCQIMPQQSSTSDWQSY